MSSSPAIPTRVKKRVAPGIGERRPHPMWRCHFADGADWPRLGAVMLLGLGGWVIWRSSRDLRHGHSHGHSHDHGHGHDDAKKTEGFAGVAMIGLSNGMSCPALSALAALLVALSSSAKWLSALSPCSPTAWVWLWRWPSWGSRLSKQAGRARTWLPSDAEMLWLPLASGILVAGTGCWLAHPSFLGGFLCGRRSYWRPWSPFAGVGA